MGSCVSYAFVQKLIEIISRHIKEDDSNEPFTINA